MFFNLKFVINVAYIFTVLVISNAIERVFPTNNKTRYGKKFENMRERERGRERESGNPRLIRHGPPRRYSPSPEVRYYRGGRGPSRVSLYGGGIGESGLT